MNFGDNSNVVNAPIVTSEIAAESPIMERLRTCESQEENYNENKQKSKDMQQTRQCQGSPLSNFNDKKPVLEVATDSHQSSVVSQTGVKRSAERVLREPSPSSTPLSDGIINNDNSAQSTFSDETRRLRAQRRGTAISPVTLEFSNANHTGEEDEVSIEQRVVDSLPNANMHSFVRSTSEIQNGMVDQPGDTITPTSSVEEQRINEGHNSHTEQSETEDLSPEDAEAASLRLAMELQQQESMMVYQQMQQMQAAMAQSAAEARSNGNLDNNSEDEDSDLMYALELARQEQVMGEQEAEEGESFDSEEMDYEQLLALGERIGDVAQDRWRLDAPAKMAALPTYAINKKYLDEAEGNDVMCQVCQCDYEEGEEMKKLPCGHHFHTECIDRWLQDHPTCCICKKSIVVDDEDASAKSTAEQQSEEQSTGDSNTTPGNVLQRTRIHRTPSS